MEFEKCLCRKLDSKACEDLVRICNRYLSNLASDRSWQTYGDVLALTAKLNRAAMALWNVAYEGGFSTDAQAELETIFADQMSCQPVTLSEETCCISDGSILHSSCYAPRRFVDGIDSMALTRSGKCLCGAVEYQVSGQPIRVGLCHCLDCQKESGSAFATFGIWPASAFASSGKVTTFQGRCFCPACGARVFTESDRDEAEIRVGSLEEASGLIPGYELWVKRRQPWLLALPWADQFDEDRPAGNSDGPKTRNG